MKKIILAVCLMLAPFTAQAQQRQIQQFPIPGYATISGTHLNTIVTRLNNITGFQTNAPVPLTGSTISLTSNCTATGASPQTCNAQKGKVTSGTLTTAGVTSATYQINDSSVTTTSNVQCTLQAYSGTYGTNGVPVINECKPGSGNIVITFTNTHATNALNGTLQFGFIVF